MAEEERLIDDARRSREETERLRGSLQGESEVRERGAADAVDDSPPDEPWAKTSSGDADNVTDDDA